MSRQENQKSKIIYIDSHEDQYEYWTQDKAKQKWVVMKNRLDLDDQITSWKPAHKKIQAKEPRYNKKQKIQIKQEQSLKISMIEELKRRKEARNAKKAKRINLSLENKKKEYKRDCLNHSTEGLSFSKSMSHRLKKPQKIPPILISPKSYNLPDLNKTQNFLNMNSSQTPIKIYSPENHNSKFTYYKNSEHRRNKIKEELKKEEGGEHMILKLEECSTHKNEKNGLTGLLKKSKNNLMKKNKFVDDMSLRTCLIFGKKQKDKMESTFFN